LEKRAYGKKIGEKYDFGLFRQVPFITKNEKKLLEVFFVFFAIFLILFRFRPKIFIFLKGFKFGQYLADFLRVIFHRRQIAKILGDK